MSNCCSKINTCTGPLPRVSSDWTWDDRKGQILARTSAMRMTYTVEPGVYGLGSPNEDSPVFVSANYKLSFDLLRKGLKGIDAWILVLDTRGINVWCAAGKGTFGTYELMKRIKAHGLDRLVDHRQIIVPQLGAPGIEAPRVRRETGFKVIYGPVRAADINAFVSAGFVATDEMRRVRFTILDRLVLTPMEILPAFRKVFVYAFVGLLIFGLQPSGIIFRDAFTQGLPILIQGFVAVLSGALFTPVLLPFLPFRSFALKGFTMGIFCVAVLDFSGLANVHNNVFIAAFAYVLFPIWSAYIALQFTGSTTFTCMSGVKRELRFAFPAYRYGSIIALVPLIAFKLKEWGVL